MNFKEFLIDALAIAVGFILAKIVLSKLPASLGGGAAWEESYEQAEV